MNAFCDHFSSTLEAACQDYILVVKIPSNPSPIWFNSDIRHCLNKIDTLRRHIKMASPSESKLSKLASPENELERQISAGKEAYISRLTDSFQSEPKKLYCYLKAFKIYFYIVISMLFFTHGGITSNS